VLLQNVCICSTLREYIRVQACRQREHIQPFNKPVERGSQSADAVSKAVAAYLGPLPFWLEKNKIVHLSA
jgi:hypothetical protein